MITVYSKDNCPKCDTLIKKLQAEGKTFAIKKLGVDFDRDWLIQKFPGAKSFPITEETQ